MASFTDVVPQFTPYRPEFPVEAALMVGAEKERQFIEGIQITQAAVNTLRGFDIAKPEARQYLENKIQEMKGEVNTVSGNFSDRRLVNQITGLAGQIGNDPIVQNGIASTAALRKGQAEIEQAKKEGKYSIENEWDFIDQATKWMNDKDYTSKFNYQYTPYTDVRKKVMDVIKTLEANGEIVQNPFVTDARGNVQFDNNGQPILNYDIIEKHYKGKSADRIINAITASLDSNDYKQLGISGRYANRGVPPISLKEDLDKFYSDQKMSIVNAIAELEIDKVINKDNPEYQKEVEKRIEGYENQLKKHDLDYTSDLQTLSASPDTIKSRLYVNSFLRGISQAFASEERWTKYLDNPAFNNFMEKEKYELDKWYKEETLRLNWVQEQRLQMESMMKATGKDGKTPVLSYEGTKYPFDTNITSPTETSFIQETDDIEKNKYEILEDIVSKHATKAWDGWKIGSQRLEREGKQPLNKKLFLDNTYNQLKKGWDDNKNLPQSVEEQISQLNSIDKDVDTRKQALRKIKQNANEIYPGFDNASLRNKLKPVTVTSSFQPRIDFTTGAGLVTTDKDRKATEKRYNLSQDDIINIAIFEDEAGLFKGKEQKKRWNEARAQLAGKFGEEFVSEISKPFSPIRSKEFMKNYEIAREAIKDQAFKERRDYISGELLKTGFTGEPKIFPVSIEEGKDKNRVMTFLSAYKHDTDATGTNPHPDFSEGKLNDALKGTFTASIVRVPSSTKYGEDKFEVIVEDIKNDKTVKMWLTPEQAEQLTGRDFTNSFTDITTRLQYSKTGTTNYETSSLTGKFAKDAYLSKDRFPNVQQPIKADVSQSQVAGKFFVTLYTKDAAGEWIAKEIKAPTGSTPGKPNGMTIEQVEMFLYNLNDAHLQFLFNK